MSRTPYDPLAGIHEELQELTCYVLKNIKPRPDNSRVNIVDAMYELADALRGHTEALRALAKKEGS